MDGLSGFWILLPSHDLAFACIWLDLHLSDFVTALLSHRVLSAQAVFSSTLLGRYLTSVPSGVQGTYRSALPRRSLPLVAG